MSYKPGPTNPARAFVIPLQPSIADPAGVIAYAELHQDRSSVQFSDFDDLKKLIAEIEERRIHDAGRCKGFQEALDLFGITDDQYHAKMREKADGSSHAQKS